jgi:hypothetical protein
MKTKKKAGRGLVIGIALAAALALAAPYLAPLARFIPPLQDAASRNLGQPVTVEALRLRLLPTPRVMATGIRVGKAGEITIRELVVVPELVSLIFGSPAIRLVRGEGIELQESALAIPAGMPKSEGGGPLKVGRIVLEQVRLHHSVVRLPEFGVEARLADDMSLASARIAARDGTVRLTYDAESPGTAKLAMEASRWSLPAGAPLEFESLIAHGRLQGSTVELPSINGKLYGGTLSGSVRADRSGQWQLSGKADLAGVDLVPVQRALGRKAQLAGRLRADATFSARARSPELLASALTLDSPFEVTGGAYHGMDLSKVSELTVGKLQAGGSTRFDQLTGKLQVRGKRLRVEELCVRSQLLVAGGHVEVAPDRKLSGRLDVSLARTKGFVGVPVALSGTSAEPSVSLTRGAMIGAVVGTVVLPGIGTGLGASAGSALEGRAGCN